MFNVTITFKLRSWATCVVVSWLVVGSWVGIGISSELGLRSAVLLTLLLLFYWHLREIIILWLLLLLLLGHVLTGSSLIRPRIWWTSSSRHHECFVILLRHFVELISCKVSPICAVGLLQIVLRRVLRIPHWHLRCN